jgi:hypothetical protein
VPAISKVLQCYSFVEAVEVISGNTGCSGGGGVTVAAVGNSSNSDKRERPETEVW